MAGRRGSLRGSEYLLSERVDIEIGDPGFDGECYVEGPAPLAVAVLGPETRQRLAAFLRGRVRIEGGPEVVVDASLSDGALEVRLREGRFLRNRAHLSAILGEVLDVARLLVAPKDVARRIADNFRHEEHAAARLSALRMLAREFPKHPATRPTLLAACTDDSGEVRLQAAIALGAEGRKTLLDLAADRGTADAVAARAVSALGETLPLDLAEAVLRGELGEAARHPMLSPSRSETALTCLEALGRLGRVQTEGLLITALRSAGRQAIAEIQSRLSGAAPGQLSLAEREVGALSLAEADRGHLSLTGAGAAGSPAGEAGEGAKPREHENG